MSIFKNKKTTFNFIFANESEETVALKEDDLGAAQKKISIFDGEWHLKEVKEWWEVTPTTFCLENGNLCRFSF